MALSKNQLDYIPDELVYLYQELEEWSINDICRRVAKTKTWTETSELMVEALREQGYSPIEIQQRVLSRLQASPEYKEELAINTYEHKQGLKKQVAELNKKRPDLVKSAMEDVQATGMRYDMSAWEQAGKVLTASSAINQITKAVVKNANGDLKNLTASLGFKTTNGWMSEATAYQKQLNLALMKVTSGTCSYQTAVNDVVKELSKSGLRTVDYASGVSRQLDTAVRNSILTASARLTGEISMRNAIDSGEDLVEVSHHAGARSDGSGGPGDHASWQGKVYSISGKNHPKESARLGYPIKSLEKVTGYPSDPTGLMGYNCGHDFFIFFEGISEPAVKEPEPSPKIYNGKSYTLYEANQKQRQLERDIRATKRKISATKAVDGDNTKNYARLERLGKEYSNFSEAMEIREKTNRLSVVDKVVGKRVKSVVKSNESGIIKRNVAHSIDGNAKTVFNSNKSYQVSIDGYSHDVNDGLSKASFELAKLGTDTGWEHGALVNLSDGNIEKFFTDELPYSVSIPFGIIEDNPNNKYAFVHNHNTKSELSLPDVEIMANNSEIPVVIGVRNDGVIYAIESNGKNTHEYLQLKYADERAKYEKENNLSRSSYEDVEQAEKHIRDIVLKEYSKGGIMIYEE